MSYIGSAVRRLFGLDPVQAVRDHASAGKNTQTTPETLGVGTTCRKMKGPRALGSGGWSAFIRNGTAAGAA